MKNMRMVCTICIASAVMLLAALIMLPSVVEAKSKVVAIEGVSYNVNATIPDNLKLFIGKKVCITLDSGKVFCGLVKGVGNNLVHLEKLDGKDYFDALIRIKNISAIDTQFRKIQR